MAKGKYNALRKKETWAASQEHTQGVTERQLRLVGKEQSKGGGRQRVSGNCLPDFTPRSARREVLNPF